MQFLKNRYLIQLFDLLIATNWLLIQLFRYHIHHYKYQAYINLIKI